MYRCLNAETLGITGRQSELIELALSNRYKGLELDMEILARQVESRGQEYSTRCIESAKKCKPSGLHVGPWKLPVDWDGDEAKITSQLTRIPALANVAKMVDANTCFTNVLGGSNTLALKENFDFYATKLNEICELLAPHEITLGVGFHAAAKAREGMEHQFISKAEEMISLLQMVKASNVGLYLDTWNWHLGGGTLEMIEKLGVDKLVAISVADVPAGATADTIETNQRLLPDPAGVIPHVDMLNRLHELEFAGAVTPLPHISQYKGVTRDKIVAKVADALRGVWPGADLLEEAKAEAEESGETEKTEEPAAASADAKAADAKAEEKEGAAAENGKESVTSSS